MAERASTLGGTYIHRLFCIPPRNYTPQRLAEIAVSRILRRPFALQYLLILDILCLDEAGQNPAQLLATCDIILRRLRGSDLFLGGVVLLCTLDHLQLRPIKGIPLLLSPHIMSCFRMFQLKQLVRSSQDQHLQRIIDICRMSKTQYEEDPSVIGELRNLLSTHCTWVDSWDSTLIPSNATRVFGMKKPAQKAEERYINEVKQNCLRERMPFKTVCSIDLQQARQSHAQWIPATRAVTTRLNRLVKEPAILALYKFAIYEFTFNQHGQFNQTQLAILCDIPSDETISLFQPFSVLAAPPGVKDIDFEIVSKQQLIDLHWKECQAVVAPQFTRTLQGGMKAKRQQYGLRPHISGTLHAVMGSTLFKVATEINIKGTGNQLWEKAKLLF